MSHHRWGIPTLNWDPDQIPPVHVGQEDCHYNRDDDHRVVLTGGCIQHTKRLCVTKMTQVKYRHWTTREPPNCRKTSLYPYK